MNLKKITLSFSAFTLALASSFAQDVNAGTSAVKPFNGSFKKVDHPFISRSHSYFVTEDEVRKVGDKVSAIGAVSLAKAKPDFRAAKSALTKLRKTSNKAGQYLRKANYTAEDTLFFENWSSWDGVAFDYLPSTWREKSNIDESLISSVSGYNPTWQIYEGDGYYLPYATSGNYVACIPYSSDILGADNKTVITPAPQQDEWIVSPMIAGVKASNCLSFDVALTPYFLHYFAEETDTVFDINRLSCDLEVLVGESGRQASFDENDYTCVLKMSDYVDELIAKTNMEDDNEIMKNLMDFAWHHFSIPLAEFEGKNIRVAFRYTGKKGTSMLLDAVRVSDLLPQAGYLTPEGCFYYAFSTDFMLPDLTGGIFMLAPAKAELTWQNHSNEDAKSFEWSYMDAEGKTVVSTDENLLMPVGPAMDYVTYPQLKVMGGDRTDTYTKQGYVKYGGHTGITYSNGVQVVYGASNCDFSKQYWAAASGPGKYVFGTGGEDYWNGKKVHGIGNLFDKPASPYLITEAWLSLMEFSARTTAEFHCTIYKVEDNAITEEVIATTAIKAKDVKKVTSSDGSVFYTMEFPFDKTLYIDSAIFVFIEGFNQTGVMTIAPISQTYNHDSGLSYAFVALDNNGDNYTLIDVASRIPSMDGYGPMCVSMYISMNAVFPYLYPLGSDEVVIPNEGGTVNVACETYFSPENWYLYPEAEWIKVEKEFDETTFTSSLAITADPLPEGVEGRRGVVRVVSMGTEMNVTVLQGDGSVSIETVESAGNVMAKFVGDALRLNYPNGATSVSVYNMAGQLVKSADLPASGNCTVSAAELGRGTYILRFEGNTQKTVKAIK